MQIENLSKPKNLITKIIKKQNKLQINSQVFQKTCRFTTNPKNTTKTSIYHKNKGLTIGYEGKQTLGLDISRYQTNIPMNISLNKIFYFEAKINNLENEGIISIGLTKKNFPFKKFPGGCRKSGANYGFCSNGEIKCNKNKVFHSEAFAIGDVIGFGYNFLEKNVFLSFNKKLLDFRFEDVPLDYYFPTLGMSSDCFEVCFNFGESQFDFDIEGYVRDIEENVNKNIFLRRNFDEINNNIMNYFLVNGFEKSFFAFYHNLENKNNLKFIMNEKDKIKNPEIFYPKQKSIRKKSRNKSYRRDSERYSSRRGSMKKIENLLNNENEDVKKLLKIRNGKIKRFKKPIKKRRNSRFNFFTKK